MYSYLVYPECSTSLLVVHVSLIFLSDNFTVVVRNNSLTTIVYVFKDNRYTLNILVRESQGKMFQTKRFSLIPFRRTANV